MTKLIALDPGNEKTAYVLVDHGGSIIGQGILPNDEISGLFTNRRIRGAVLAVEMIASYGMPVGREVFETCLWIGRFVEAWGGEHQLIYRRDVKLHLCNSSKAKDANVRQALLDKFGGKARAIGSKKARGPLYGFAADMWSALAVAATWWDANQPEPIGAAEPVRNPDALGRERDVPAP